MVAERKSATAGADQSLGAETRRALLLVGAAWALPGLGHWLLGKTRRAVVFAVLVLGSFGLGLAHDGRLALHSQEHPYLTTFQLVANIGVGPSDLLARLSVYGAPAYWLPRDRSSPRREEWQTIFRGRMKSPLANFGTAYLWTAGLMNLLLLFDVWDIARRRKV